MRFSLLKIALVCCVVLAAVAGAARKKQLPAIRWQAGAPGCEFQRGDDGRYRWRFAGGDLDMTLLMDSQELAKSQHRLYKPLGVFMSVTYTGQDKFEFPADLRMEFVRHHNVIEGFLDPTEFSTKMQNDVDTKVFDTEREIKKHPEQAEEKTNRAREFQKQVAEFIEFLSTQSLEPAILNPGNPEVHGWVFFGTKNKWLGSWKSREDFILRVWMKDKVWEFPFSLPPSEGDLILRKRDE
jgi:SAM-dependent methyltransferase